MTDSWLSLWFRGYYTLAIDFLRIWTIPLDRFRTEHEPQPSPLASATEKKVMVPQPIQFRDRKSSAVAKRRSKQRRKNIHVSRYSVGATKPRARVGKKGRR
jgi:hypothetical protein